MIGVMFGEEKGGIKLNMYEWWIVIVICFTSEDDYFKPSAKLRVGKIVLIKKIAISC